MRKDETDPADNRFLLDFTLHNNGNADIPAGGPVPLSVCFARPNETDPARIQTIVPGAEIGALPPGGSQSFTDIPVAAPAPEAGFDPGVPLYGMALSVNYGGLPADGGPLIMLPAHGASADGNAGSYLTSFTGDTTADRVILGQLRDEIARGVPDGPGFVRPDPMPVPASYPAAYTGSLNLTALDLSGADLSGLAPFQSIPGLSLSDTGADLSTLPPLAGLFSLNISHNGYATADLANINGTKFPLLTELWTSNNNLSDVAPFATLENLAYLEVSHNQITDLSSLAGHPALGTLIADNNRIESLASLRNMHSLTVLAADSNRRQSIDLPPDTLAAMLYLTADGNHIVDFSFINHIDASETRPAGCLISAIAQTRSVTENYPGSTLRVEVQFILPEGDLSPLYISDGGREGSAVWDNVQDGKTYSYEIICDDTTADPELGLSGVRFGGTVSVTARYEPPASSSVPTPSSASAPAPTPPSTTTSTPVSTASTPAPVTTASTPGTATPQTGDDAPLGLFGVLALLSGGAWLLLRRYKP